MTGAAIAVLMWFVAVLGLIILILCATVVIRRNNDMVRDPRAITARYENKLSNQDTERFAKDWERYYDDDN